MTNKKQNHTDAKWLLENAEAFEKERLCASSRMHARFALLFAQTLLDAKDAGGLSVRDLAQLSSEMRMHTKECRAFDDGIVNARLAEAEKREQDRDKAKSAAKIGLKAGSRNDK
jgi:hypothetical protein